MRRSTRWALVSLMLCIAFAGCGKAATEQRGDGQPATVEPIEGTELRRVVLSSDAAERIGIQTTPVRERPAAGGRTARKVIPYGAVLYDPNGMAWTYINPEPLTFVRFAITLESINGDVAVLSSGPRTGTNVVTVGAAELYGAENGVGH